MTTVSELQRELAAAAADRKTLQTKLDVALAENARLCADLDQARLEKSRFAFRSLDWAISDAELAERKARRRAASAHTGTSKPGLVYARDWLLEKFLAGACDRFSPAKLDEMLVKDAEAAGESDGLPSQKWLVHNIARLRDDTEAQRLRAAQAEERLRLEELADERQRELAGLLAYWVQTDDIDPDGRRSSS